MDERLQVEIGVLHSMSGAMALSETPLIRAVQLAVEEINRNGGVLNHQIKHIIEDGASHSKIFKEKAEKLLVKDKVATIFGCWTSSSRKAVKPVIERHHSLLWYPVQYEGLEQSPNIIYSGSCLNQQIDPAVAWALAHGKKRFFVIGSDYIYPRIANQLISTLVSDGGGTIVAEQYVPLDSPDFTQVITAIKELKPDIIFNTINGDGNLSFFRACNEAGFNADFYPIMSFSFGESQMQDVKKEAAGHYACWSYFQNLQTPRNHAFLRKIRERFGEETVISDPFVMAYIQVYLWKKAVEAAGTFDAEVVLKHVVGQSAVGPGGSLVIQANHHLKKPVLIGKAMEDGQFDVVWRSNQLLDAKPWLGIEDVKLPAQNLILDVMGEYPDTVHLYSELQVETSKRKSIEQELLRNEAKYRMLAENSSDMIWTMTTWGQITYVSPVVTSMLGYTPEECKKLSLKQLFTTESYADVREGLRRISNNIQSGDPVMFQKMELECLRKDGSSLWTETIVKIVYNDYDDHIEILGVTHDITERKSHEDELERANETIAEANAELSRISITDFLTGLYNRRYSELILETAISQSQRYGTPLSVIMFDIDHFKAVNDNFGHKAGDQVLKELGQRIRINLRSADHFVRWGGEEFMIIAPQCGEAEAMEIAQKLRVLIEAQPFSTVGTITASFGVAELRKDETQTDWFRRVDQAMYEAKSSGRNRVQLADSKLVRD